MSDVVALNKDSLGHLRSGPAKGSRKGSKRRMGHRPEERTGPTPQTRLKQIHDYIKPLGDDYERSAIRIAHTWEALHGAQSVRGQLYERRGKGHGEPLNRVSQARLDAYNAWQDELCRSPGRHRAWFNAVIAMVVFLEPVHRVAETWHRPIPTIIEWLIEALDIYGRLERS